MKEKSSKKSTILKIIGIVLGIIIIVAIGVVIRYFAAYNGFLDKITTKRPEVKEYSVAVLEDSNFKEIADLKDKSTGFLKIDPNSQKAEQKLQSEVKIISDFYEDLDTLTSALESRITDSIVLESSRIEAIKDEAESQMNNIRIIYTYEIELDGEEVTVSDKEIMQEPTIIYISGSDSRTGIQTTARSDVNIIAVVNPEQGKILLVSIPRDTYVQLHDTVGLKDKLTHAGIYGINMSKTTIEDFLDIKIDYTIKVSFDTVIKVVDEIDGITINSDQAMTLKTNSKTCEYVAGAQQVDGDCALRFARERKSYTTGDRHRGENQQAVLTAIINKLTSSKNYILKVPAILDIAADSFETDVPRDDISAFLRKQLTDPIKWKVESISIDGVGTMEPTYSMGANRPLYVMIPNSETIENAKAKINEYLIIESLTK